MFKLSRSAKLASAGSASPARADANPTKRAEAATAKTPRPDLSFSVGVASRRGPREKNEDAASVSSNHRLFAIADGIGGAPLGDIMSTASCNAAISAYEDGASLFESFNEANLAAIELKQLLWTHNPATENLSPLITATNLPAACQAKRAAAARAILPAAGAGSTILLAECKDARLNLVWAGDTIALLWREGTLRTVAAPDNVQGTNELGSAVGYESQATPLFATYDLKPDDRILLCTDGVWASLEEERLADLLTASENAPWVAQMITREAAEQGTDNATAIVLIAEEAAGTPAPDSGEDAPCAQLPLPAVPCTPNYPAFRYA